jgi:hypothetical protein
MHGKNFYPEFLDILKNDFRPAGAYAHTSQSGFPDKTCLFELCDTTVYGSYDA